MDHYKNPRNQGMFEDELLTVDMNNPTCGDRIHLTLESRRWKLYKMRSLKVKDAQFQCLLHQ